MLCVMSGLSGLSSQATAAPCAGEAALSSAADSVKPSASGSCPRGCILGVAYRLGRQHVTIGRAKVISLVAVILLLVCHSASRYYSDSDSCQWLLSTGHFLQDDVWQPDGCMMHDYSSTEIKACLAVKKVVFVGDSRILGLFLSVINITTSAQYVPPARHKDVHFRDNSSSARVDFLWNPKPDSAMQDRLTSLSTASEKPDAIIIGAATWSIKDSKGSSEGLQRYTADLASMAAVLETLAQSGDVYWHIQEPVRWPALKPIQKSITNLQIDLYNKAAEEVFHLGSSRIKVFAASRRASLQRIEEIPDGLHMPHKVRHLAAMVLINSLCNKVVRPIDGSCCQTMPPLTFPQKMALCLFVGSALLFLVLHSLNKRRRQSPPDVESLKQKEPATVAGPPGAEAVCWALCRMGLIMLYFYLCDRADVFMKEQKQYSHGTFFIPLTVILVLGLFWSDRTKESHALNREQTDEWKGWMQLVILIYHISGASACVPVYMHIRTLVAAYLFQTGYGHWSFFWLKADFGLYRVSQVLFRLNVLVLLLCAVMDRPYQFYYFVPLVTFWFLVIYGTVASWPQIVQKNADNGSVWRLGVLLKLLFLLLLICLLAGSQVVFDAIFTAWPFCRLFQLNGSVHEWHFRWTLDRFSVLQGMLFAFVYLLLQKKQLLMETRGNALFSAKLSIPLLLLSLLLFITYSVWASNCTSKAQCNALHPYLSVVPIVAFILIRNIPGSIRCMYSSFFAWFGKISLELFICQYHVWLAADTKGILVLIPGSPALNILVTSFIFVCVAHEVSLITNVLAQGLIPKDTVALLTRLGAVGLLWLLLLLARRVTTL